MGGWLLREKAEVQGVSYQQGGAIHGEIQLLHLRRQGDGEHRRLSVRQFQW